MDKVRFKCPACGKYEMCANERDLYECNCCGCLIHRDTRECGKMLRSFISEFDVRCPECNSDDLEATFSEEHASTSNLFCLNCSSFFYWKPEAKFTVIHTEVIEGCML